MGLFDTVYVADYRFRCSEGHWLGAEEFQTKDLGEGMETYVIGDDRIDPLPDYVWGTRVVRIYCACRQCPAFVQSDTFNVVDCWVEFDVTFDDGKLVDVKLTSMPTADWLKAQPTEKFMKGCLGPMPWEEAQKVSLERIAYARALRDDT